MQRNRAIGSSAALLLLAGVALTARPATADWLVTHEGARVETRGPLQVKGKLVVFTTADGTLASLRVDQVDLPASEKLTAEKQRMVEEDIARPVEKRKAARAITDRDVGHSGAPALTRPATPAEAAAGKPDKKAEDGKGEGTDAKKSKVIVGSWQKVDRAEKDGIEIVGEIKNEAAEIAGAVTLTVTLLDETGSAVGSAKATLSNTSIQPLKAISFRAVFPGVFTFASAKFDLQSLSLRLQAIDRAGEKPKGP